MKESVKIREKKYAGKACRKKRRNAQKAYGKDVQKNRRMINLKTGGECDSRGKRRKGGSAAGACGGLYHGKTAVADANEKRAPYQGRFSGGGGKPYSHVLCADAGAGKKAAGSV